MKNTFLFLVSFFIINNSSLAQDFPTIEEIYDYDIGDIFHHRGRFVEGGPDGHYSDTTIRNMEVVGKYYSENSDTVYYEFFVKELAIFESNPQGNSYTEYYTTKWYTDLDAIQDGDEIIEDPNIYNGRKTVKYHNMVMNGSIEQVTSYHWTVGCGLTYQYSSYFDMAILFGHKTINELVYLKKGDEEWGNEQIILNIPENTPIKTLKPYPNPAQNYISISNSGDKLGLIKIFNSTGLIVKSQKISSQKASIDISSLPNGLYFLRQINDHGKVLFTSNFIKAQ